MPLVSVIIPTYNRAKYLPDAIDSVLKQTFQDFEVIVVDDGSTDDTSAVMHKYESDPRVRYFSKENGGCATARNFGLKQARGEFVEHLDSDDVLVENDLELKVAAIKSLPEDVAGVMSDCYRYLKPDKPEATTFFQNFDFMHQVKDIVDQKIGDDLFVFSRRFYEHNLTQCLLSPNILVRKSVYDEVGFYNQGMRSGQDWEWFVRLTKVYRIAYLDVPLMKYRFWVCGNASNPISLMENRLLMFDQLLGSEYQPRLRRNIKYAIGFAHFNLAYLYYKKNEKKKAAAHARCSLFRLASPIKSLGIIILCLMPEPVARAMKKINPNQGRPIN